MQPSRLRARYRYIMSFFFWTTMSVIFWDIILARLGMRSWSRKTRAGRYRQIAVRFRLLAIRMGGVLIKVGQFLSARLDVLPLEITQELSGLQDEVPAEDFDAIRGAAEKELGAPLEEIFERFETTPLAAASLGQVHRAWLLPADAQTAGYQEVVVKIQRPFIDELIDVDFSALRRFAGWLQHYEPIRKRVDVSALVEELSETVHNEIDYLAEGKNAERFRANFAKRKRIHVPRIVWSRTTRRVLTLENVYAIKITDYAAITAAGIDRVAVAHALFDTYLKQIFEDQFFHADPHPGNLFVTPVPATKRKAASWRLTFVDFGMVGTVPVQLRHGLRDMLVGVGLRDASKVVVAYQSLGILLPGADLRLLEQAESRLFDAFWGKSMSDLRKIRHGEMRQFALQFRELMFSMPFQFPQNLLLLGRTLAILSGMCTGLDPEFNLWTPLAPYAQKLMADEASSSWDTWMDIIGDLVKELLALPGQTGRVLTNLERGEMTFSMPQVTRQLFHLESAVNRLVAGLVFATLLFAGIWMRQGGDNVLGNILLVCSVIAFLWMVFWARGHLPV